MAFFEDLTPYTYLHPEEELPGTVNVGCLDKDHSFPTGQTSEEVTVHRKMTKPAQLRAP